MTLPSTFRTAALAGVLCAAALAQPAGTNFDESKVPPYTLPDPLVLADGRAVRDAKTWIKERRPEILRLFEANVYGRSPGKPEFRMPSTPTLGVGVGRDVDARDWQA